MLADKLCKSRLVAYLVICAVVSKKYVRAAEQLAADGAGDLVVKVMLANLSTQIAYAICPYVNAVVGGRVYFIYKAANFTRIPTKDVRTCLFTV